MNANRSALTIWQRSIALKFLGATVGSAMLLFSASTWHRSETTTRTCWVLDLTLLLRHRRRRRRHECCRH